MSRSNPFWGEYGSLKGMVEKEGWEKRAEENGVYFLSHCCYYGQNQWQNPRDKTLAFSILLKNTYKPLSDTKSDTIIFF
jgi:hypothetical protein